MAGLIRGEIRLCVFPPPDKQRPVVILTRQSSIRLLNKVTVAPITSTIRGGASEVVLDETDGMKAPCAINLYNLLTLPRERVGMRIGSLSDLRVSEICEAVAFALGCGTNSAK
jgi:mRNA interferase MazF